MLTVSTIENPNAADVQRGRLGPKGHESACLVCGRGIKDATTAKWVHLHGGGAFIVTEAEAAEMNAGPHGRSADMGAHPIGADCYRKHRTVLEQYV